MKRIFVPLFVLLICALPGARQAVAQSYPAAPETGSYVADPASVLTLAAEQYLNDMSRGLEELTTAQVAVAVVETTSPETIEGYTLKLFEQWQPGQAGQDNGVLLVVAINDRTLRIEPGYGLEGALTDIECKRIIDEMIVPHFKDGNFIFGIVLGYETIVAEVLEEYGMTHDDLPVARPELPAGRDTPPAPAKAAPRDDNMPSTGYIAALFGGVLGVIALIMFVVWKMPSSGSGGSSGGSTWSSGGGSSGGSSGSFGGGGSSGGGGASGSW